MHNNIFFVAVLVFVMSACSSQPTDKSSSVFSMVESIQIQQTYKSLKILDLDDMSDLLYEKANDYKKNNRIQSLREGALIAFSRPNEDVILDKIINIVRNPLEDADEWESTVEQMVGQAVNTIKNASSLATDQVTASIVLENVLSEFKPQFVKQYQSGGFETTVVERIAASDLKFSNFAEQEKKLNQMKSGLSPSQLAQRLVDLKNKKLEELKEIEKKKKKNK